MTTPTAAAGQHDWREAADGRGVRIQRRCLRCGKWETDATRAAACKPPKVRVR